MIIPSPLPEQPRTATANAACRRSWADDEAANEPFPAAIPALRSPPRRGPPETPRLAGAFLASLMLHLALAILASSTLTYTAIRSIAGQPLTVTLTEFPGQLISHVSESRPAQIPETQQRQSIQPEPMGPQQQPARFLADPDLSLLEQIPTTIPGVVSLQLHVTGQGLVDRVSIIRTDPVPKELLDGLVERFSRARLSPALVGSQPTASTVEVTIRVEPPAQPLEVTH